MRHLNLLLLATILVFLMSMQAHEAIRIPFPHKEGGPVVEKAVGLLESLRTPVPPSGPSGCTHIPSSGGICVNEMNYAGRTMAPLLPQSSVGILANNE
ncbi:hypothetical protein MANES_05G086832v8 [Manihot esculenta]|uniref:Uncharacterized protein n=1 Tax=Manihot esculenta TaxID=3983 RepID=A0A2C9VUJ7_MANES|nr:hypothetical protein MANES_05G086832v8 [Manihot esculenta]